MKKRLVAVLVMVVVLMIAACGNSKSAEESIGADNQMTENGTDTDVPSSLEGVTMEVTEYSDTSVTVRITNDTNMNIRCGEDFRLKILDEETGEWRDLDTVIDDYGFFEEAYIIQKDSPYEMVIDFEWLYGKLEPGRYQIVKTVMDFRGTGDYTNYVFTAEFDISMEVTEHSVAEALVTSQKDCGTFNDTVNEKRLHLTEEQQAAVNAILEKYIVLGIRDALVTEEKPAQLAENSVTPQDGTIQDGKIYILGFGWVDYEGGGTQGTYAEDIFENGNTIGTMD